MYTEETQKKNSFVKEIINRKISFGVLQPFIFSFKSLYKKI